MILNVGQQFAPDSVTAEAFGFVPLRFCDVANNLVLVFERSCEAEQPATGRTPPEALQRVLEAQEPGVYHAFQLLDRVED
jgi:hypothetical protein